MSVPYSRQTVRLSFTKRNDDDKPLQNPLQIGVCTKRVNDEDQSTSTSKSTSSAPQEVQPHAAKQRADVALLMRDLAHFTDGKHGLNLKRCSSAGEDGVIVFLIERNWWDTWMIHEEPIPGCGIPRINNWSLVEEQDKESSSGPSLSPIRLHSSGMNGSEQGMSDKHYADRYHLRRGLSESDFKIVTFEVWTTLTAWYGGSPPLPALLATRSRSNENGESSSKLNGKRNEVNGRYDLKELSGDYAVRYSQDESSGSQREDGTEHKDNGLSRSEGEYITIGEDLWPETPYSVGDVLELEFSLSSSAFSTSNITPAPSYCATENSAVIGCIDGLSGQGEEEGEGEGHVPSLIQMQMQIQMQSLKSQSPAFSASAAASASTSATESLSSDNLSPSSTSSSVSLSASVSAHPSRRTSATVASTAAATDCGDYLSDTANDADAEADTGKREPELLVYRCHLLPYFLARLYRTVLHTVL